MPRTYEQPKSKRRGRPLGAASKRTRELADAAAAAGKSPLDYCLRVINDESVDALRRDALAIAALPYTSPKLSRSVTVDDQGKVVDRPSQTTINILPIPSGFMQTPMGELVRMPSLPPPVLSVVPNEQPIVDAEIVDEYVPGSLFD